MTIIEQLSRDEGRSATGYKDSLGIWTIGVGHNVESGPPIPESAIDLILESDLKRVIDELARRAPWCLRLDPVRHGAIVNLAFNLGVTGLLGFPRMIQALQQDAWELAAKELLDSRYATQVGQRAVRLAEQLRTGAWK